MHCHVNSNNSLFSFITLLSYMYIHTTKTSFKYGATVSFRLYHIDNGRHGLPWHFEALLTKGTLPRHTPHFVARVLSPVTNRWGMLWCILRGGISWVSMLYRWARGVRIALGTLFIGVRHATAAFSWGVSVLSTFSFNGPFNCNTKITKNSNHRKFICVYNTQNTFNCVRTKGSKVQRFMIDASNSNWLLCSFLN